MEKIRNNIIEKEWITKSGHRAIVLFIELGHRCGYVEVSKDSFLYGKDYSYYSINLDDIDTDFIKNIDKYRAISNINVHGGITFVGDLLPNSYWFGFDTAHSCDGVDYKTLEEYYPDNRLFDRIDLSLRAYEEVRSLEYCIEQCEMLSEQLAHIEKM